MRSMKVVQSVQTKFERSHKVYVGWYIERERQTKRMKFKIQAYATQGNKQKNTPLFNIWNQLNSTLKTDFLIVWKSSVDYRKHFSLSNSIKTYQFIYFSNEQTLYYSCDDTLQKSQTPQINVGRQICLFYSHSDALHTISLLQLRKKN